MKFLPLLIILSTLLLVSCENTSEDNVSNQDVKTTSSLFGSKKTVFTSLSENAKMYMMQWGAFEDFEKEAKNLNGSTIESLKEKSERLVLQVDSLSKRIPDTLKTEAITSRVMVVKTRASILKQELFMGQVDSARLQTQIAEMNTATNNLIIQINEKFQKDNIDFQRKDDEKKELEKQKQFLDSVYQSELKDNLSN
ncbi:hypothetical protein [Ulvibacter litoralis]|nr:hypothetical protein [Ulvibacter litoralis]GHC45330.1 hypothetical protein GCM10008083_05110 [Ulvibacter litoralis]